MALVNIMKPEYKVLPGIPADGRLTAMRHTDSLLPITRFFSTDEVEKRKRELRENLLMAAGLFPMPKKTPLNVKTELVGEFDGYSVKKIMFETRPGFWSTGNLYMPKKINGKAPAILNVIGHWEPQRLYRGDDADYPQQLANFARMGFVCLVTDMIGWVDSRQIKDHYYGGGEKELYASNGLGIQLWNNIRALDLLSEMPEVDAERIGVTGASGGGSQTLFLGLADDRVKAQAPINMISLKMQGGCQCENAAGLRINTDNAEMCAMFAPKPLFIAGSTGDWTCDQENIEYPALLESYRLYGAENMVEHYYQVADHQYNKKTRQRVYSFFARHLMGKEMDWVEQDIEVKDVLDLTWFRNEGCAPGIQSDDEFFSAHKKERIDSVNGLCADDKKKLLSWMLGTGEGYTIADASIEIKEGLTIRKNIINSKRGQQIPFVTVIPDNWDKKRVTLAVSGRGKECLEDDHISALLKDGVCVVSGDIFLTGEYGDAKVNIVGSENAKKYFTTFNYTCDQYRAQDIEFLWKEAKKLGEDCSLWAHGNAARNAAAVLPLLDDVKEAMLEKAPLKLSSDCEYLEKFHVPSILSLGGIEGCLKLKDAKIKLF